MSKHIIRQVSTGPGVCQTVFVKIGTFLRLRAFTVMRRLGVSRREAPRSCRVSLQAVYLGRFSL